MLVVITSVDRYCYCWSLFLTDVLVIVATLFAVVATLFVVVFCFYGRGREQVCSVTSPFFLSHATNSLYAGDLIETMKYVGLYALLAFTAKALKEAQSLVYLK